MKAYLSLIHHRNVIFRNWGKKMNTFGKAIDETFSTRFINQTVETDKRREIHRIQPFDSVNGNDDRGEIGIRRRRSSIDLIAPSPHPVRAALILACKPRAGTGSCPCDREKFQ